MELKWLEDFVCVAEKGHFARAASERFVTQSALSRRIQSLEAWVGTELLDRSEHPIQLTAAGHEFIKFARDLINRSYEGRAITSEFAKIDKSSITIACLHTLALNYVPKLVHELQSKIGPFATSVVAETRTIEEYLTGLYNGSSDFFICYGHQAIPLDVDTTHFPRLEMGQHWVRPYQAKDADPISLAAASDDRIHYLEYSANTYMSRVVIQAMKNAPFRHRLHTVYLASLAESIYTATQSGLGISWLPETIASDTPEDQGLRLLSTEWATPLHIRVYRSAKNTNPSVNKIWEQLQNRTTQ